MTADAEDIPTGRYGFRPFTAGDLPMMAEWLRTPEVAKWWGDPEQQLRLVTEDLSEPAMRQWIVEHDGTPFAYVQASEAQAWPEPHLDFLPPGVEAIDTCIGVPAMLGAGHASHYLRQFAAMLIEEGAKGVVIDPDVDNERAQRAYERAGFVRDCVIEAPDGDAVVMIFSHRGAHLADGAVDY